MNTMCRSNFKKSAHAVLMAVLALVFATVPFVRVSASEGLASLNEAQQDAVMRLCTPSQFLVGPQAFRDCLLQKVEEVQNNTDVQFSALSGLALDEQHVIQRFCSSSESSLSSPIYLKCAGTQLSQLEDEPQPSLADIAPHEQYAITQQCFDSASTAGARDYRACVNNAIDTLAKLPAAVFTHQSTTARNTIELECSRNTSSASDYRECLLDTLGVESTSVQDISDQTPDETDSNSTSEPSVAPEQPGSTSDPIASETVDSASLTDSTEPTIAAPVPSATLDKMRPAYWAAAAIFLTIPLILMGLWFRRRSARSRFISQLKTTSVPGEALESHPEENTPIRPDLKPFVNDTVDHTEKTVDLKLVRQTPETVSAPDLSTPEPSTPEPSKPEPSTPDLSTPEPSTPEPSNA